MKNFNMNFNTIHSARQFAEIEKEREREMARQMEEEMRKVEQFRVPIIDHLELLSEQAQEQLVLLQEENERQKEQLQIAEQNGKLAKKEARRSKIFAIVTFCVATAISIASLIVAIVK